MRLMLVEGLHHVGFLVMEYGLKLSDLFPEVGKVCKCWRRRHLFSLFLSWRYIPMFWMHAGNERLVMWLIEMRKSLA